MIQNDLGDAFVYIPSFGSLLETPPTLLSLFWCLKNRHFVDFLAMGVQIYIVWCRLGD